MDGLFKRALAYSLDMLLVVFVASNIAASPLNYQYNDYMKYVNESNELKKIYKEQSKNKIESCEDLVKAIDEEKLTEEEYVTLYEDLLEIKEKIDDVSYNDKCQVIVDKYNENKLTYNEYISKFNYYEQKREASSLVLNIILLILIFAYFVLFQGFTHGQTLGKKIMRLKVVSTTNKSLSYKQLFLRSIFLYEVIFTIIKMISSIVMPLNYYVIFYNINYCIFEYLLNLILIFTICFDKNHRGIHDLIAKTRVIAMDFKGNVIKEKPFINFSNSKKVDKYKNK